MYSRPAPVVVLFAFAALLLGAAPLLPAAEVLTTDSLPPTRLRFGSLTVYSENDHYFAGTDQHYTNGFKLALLSTELKNFTDDPVPRPIQSLVRSLDRVVVPGRDCKLGFALGQNIYTPTAIHTSAPQPYDRPYAAWLYGGLAFQTYLAPRVFATGWRAIGQLDTFEVNAGLVGPGALGRQIQNGFHDIIHRPHADGWSNQIHNEAGLTLGFERKYRVATTDARTGWGADLIGHGGVTLGNIFTSANAGAEVRAGWRLPADFGTDLIRPSSDSNSRRRPAWSLFGFAAFDARAVARDVTLDGNTFRESPRVKRRPFVNDFLSGAAIGTQHWQFTYSQAVRSREFAGQPQRSLFGSISATFYY